MRPLQLKFHTRFKNYFVSQKKLTRLTLRAKHTAGRSKSGRIAARFKTSLTRRFRTSSLNLNLRFQKLIFISTFTFVPFRNRLISLIYFSNGAASYYLTSSHHELFDYYAEAPRFLLRKKSLSPLATLIFKIRKLTRICSFELLPARGIQYCKSAGAAARIFSQDPRSKLVLLILPSKQKKLFSYFSIAQVGCVLPETRKKYTNLRAGF
jgi:ribosomal protein L2